jgi:hypothetical protein
MLPQKRLRFLRIQATRDVEVHDAHTPGGQKPGFPEDSEARVLIQG